MLRAAPLLAALTTLAAPGPRAALQGATPAAPRAPSDPALCAGCHPGVVASYAGTGMARALRPIEPGELDGLGEVADAAGGFRYRFRQRGAKAYLVEAWDDPDAEGGVRERLVRLSFAIGAGLLDSSYAAALAGRAWFAPLEVLSAAPEHERHAALAPGHMMRPGTRFETALTEECLACHTDALPPRAYPANLVPRDFAPRGVSCDACHGDGAAHADWRERALAGEPVEGPDPILDVAGLDLPRRLSICARCHLQGDARIALTPGARGVPPPGGDFLDDWAVFVPPVPDPDVAFVSHVERTVLSPCFQRSLGTERELSCELCHDPHTSVFEPEARARVRAACGLCHARDAAPDSGMACALPASERAARDCAGCHMRRTEVFDVAGVQIHDHYVRRRPGGSSRFDAPREKHTRDGRLAPFSWTGAARPEVEGDPGLALMAALIARFPAVAAEHLDAAPGALAAALPTYHHLRGVLLERAARHAEAEAAYRRAAELDPRSVESQVNRALALMRLSRGEEALALCDALLAEHPRADGVLRNRAIVRLSLGDPAGFAADLEAAQRLLPRALNARALAEHFRRRGDAAHAARWDEEAARLGE